MLCSRVPLYQPMYSTMARRAAVRVGQGRRSSSSALRVAKKDSATALSQHWPVRPIDSAHPCVVGEAGELGAGVLAAAVGVEDHPGAGPRVATALVRASSIRSVRR